MGSLASSIFDLISGDPTASEEGKLGGLGDYETGVGEGLTTAGAGEEEGILSGDPTKIAQVEAPEITAQQGEIEQNLLENSNFGTRSGGTTASNEDAQAKGRANIIDLTGGLIGKTAGEAVEQGSGFLGQASSNINDKAGLDAANRKRVTGDIGGIGTGVAQIASDLFTGGAAPPPAPGTGDELTSGPDFGFTPQAVPGLGGPENPADLFSAPTLPDATSEFEDDF